MANSTATQRSLFAPACKSKADQYRTAYQALDAVLKKWNYSPRSGVTGAYNCRKITGGTGYSLHAFGPGTKYVFWNGIGIAMSLAVDINWDKNPYGPNLITDMPRGMVDEIEAIRSASGKQVWRWGGYYAGNKDAMHFEIVCSPADLTSGIAGNPGSGATTPPVVTPPASNVASGYAIFAGQVLPRGHELRSPNGKFSLSHQGDGNVVLYGPDNKALWTTKTSGRATTNLALQGDGNVVLYNGASVVWALGTQGKGGTGLHVQDDGNLVLYTAGHSVVWNTGTHGSTPVAKPPAPAGDPDIAALQRLVGASADGFWGPNTEAQCNKNIVKQGSKGNLVKFVQGRIGASADGDFGPNTKTKVVAFQKAHGLSADGAVGANTYKALCLI